MMKFRFCYLYNGIVLGTLVVLYLVFFLHALQAADVKDALETIQKIDDVYEKGVSTSGQHDSIIPPIFRGQKHDLTRHHEWRYTQSGESRAVLETANVEAGINENGGAMYHRQFLLFDQKRSGKKLVLLFPSVPIEKYMDSSDVADTMLELHTPDSETLSFEMDKFLFALGRGVGSKVILEDNTKTKFVERNGESCIFITGTSDYMSGGGVWEFYVLADAAYMLRHAKYFRGSVILEIETFGLKQNKDCFFPEKSEIKIPLGSKTIVHSFVFSSADLGFDSGLFDKVVREFDEELPEGSLKMDSSSGKDIVQVIGGEEPHAPHVLQPGSFFSRRGIFIILVGIALIIYICYRNRQKK